MKHRNTMIIMMILAGMLCAGYSVMSNIINYSGDVEDTNRSYDNMPVADKNNVGKGNERAAGEVSDTSYSYAQETEEKKCYYKNDCNAYDVDEDEDGIEYIVQYSLDLKTEVRRVWIKYIFEVEWVTDEWVYYTAYDDADADDMSLWRFPVRKTDNGDYMDVSDKEKLFSMYVMEDVYVTDSYVIFLGIVKENEKFSIYKYNIQNRKYSRMLPKNFIECSYIMYSEDFPLMIDGMLFVCSENNNIYQLNPDTGDIKNVYADTGKVDVWYGDHNNNVVKDGSLYFADSDSGLYKYNVGDKKAKRLVSLNDFKNIMEKLRVWGAKAKKIQIEICGFNIYNDQIYFKVIADWKMKDSKIFDKSVLVQFSSGEFLFKAPLENIEKLQYVDVVNKYFDKNTKWEKIKNKWGYYAYRDSNIYFLDGETALDAAGTYAIYNLDTGKIRKLSKKEWDNMEDDLE